MGYFRQGHNLKRQHPAQDQANGIDAPEKTQAFGNQVKLRYPNMIKLASEGMNHGLDMLCVFKSPNHTIDLSDAPVLE